MVETMTIEERTKYDTYTKAQVYEAYMLEIIKVESLERDLKRMNQHMAKIRYEVNR